MKQLRTHLNLADYLSLIKQSVHHNNYSLTALFYQDKMVALIGYLPMITLYNGKFIWVCDLITDSKARSKGYGELLLSHVEEEAKENGYDAISLSSGLQRTDAHRFYEQKMDYDKVSYVFLKKF
ncbi:GNAT family N-acetyltransferase [Aquibacillus kalidii]|uniref:GNAT family N-acetyltransferase n=1 Tax=Aquibacillus kalidii TaxID=2762597 RepID=UPI00164455E5|nr:GNAT family N-acetyltransferase [Aquibacillus kalidii]